MCSNHDSLHRGPWGLSNLHSLNFPASRPTLSSLDQNFKNNLEEPALKNMFLYLRSLLDHSVVSRCLTSLQLTSHATHQAGWITSRLGIPCFKKQVHRLWAWMRHCAAMSTDYKRFLTQTLNLCISVVIDRHPVVDQRRSADHTSSGTGLGIPISFVLHP